jgi:hypothetical protein
VKFYKCVNEVKPSYVVDTEPQFNETVLYENQTSANEDITLSDNYNNYDIIKFYCYDIDSNYTQYTQYYITPAMLNHVVTYFEGYCCFNIPNTTEYTYYRVTSNTTLTYISESNMYPLKVTGLKCGNGSIVETKIYEKQVTDSVWSPIETQYNLFNDFNMLLSITGRAADELNVASQVYVCANNKELNIVNDNDTQLTEWHVPYYSNSVHVKVLEHSISDNYWIYVAGLKFIPNWDYYIENIEFAGPYEVNTGIQLSTQDGLQRDWEMEFKTTNFGDNDARLLNNYVGGWDSFSWYFGGTNPNGTYGGYREWGGGHFSTTIAVDLNPTIWKLVKKNGIIKFYKNGVAEYDFIYNSTYGSYPTGTFKLGNAQISTQCTLHYFGFRWLS